MIIITGGAGFIGANLAKALNDRGRHDLIIVDHLKNGHKFTNLVDCQIADYWDKDDFIQAVESQVFDWSDVQAIFHLGACSATTQWDGQYMMRNNYTYSKQLLEAAIYYHIPFIYASSAATYGAGETFIESPVYEWPINVYGYSKAQFDHYVRRRMKTANNQIVGLKYFNVYGPREQHKGSMASVAYHHYQQFKETQRLKLFGAYGGYKPGMQLRDFVYVQDAVDVNLWFLDHPEVSGIYNCGTGRAEPFNHIAQAVIDYYQAGKIDYIEFPEHLKGHYQCYTQANIETLRSVGCDITFKTVAQGVRCYLDWLEGKA